MDNTIKNALNHIADSGIGGEIRHESTGVYRLSFDPAKLAASFVAYANQQCAPKNLRIAELEKQVEELGGQSILDTMKRNKALREEISDLRRALSECKAKARVGRNPEIT